MRLKDKFNQLKKEGRKAFIAYIPFGFPSIKSTKNIFLALQECGVDAVELGIPFSDPLADGPIIQKATSLAIERGANIDVFFTELASWKDSVRIPVIVMTYYNPIFRFGLEKFFKKIKRLGIQAMAIVDLPIEEARSYIEAAKRLDLDTIFFVTPTTTPQRIEKIAKQSKGFIYYISVTGITGPKDFNYASLAAHIRAVKKTTDLAVCVGFGIHNRAQIEKINKFSDGVIIGSSIIKFIENNYHNKNFLDKFKGYINSLRANQHTNA